MAHSMINIVQNELPLVGWLVGFNVGLELQWALADGLRLIPKDGPETCHHNS